jgi:hypothetical protein
LQGSPQTPYIFDDRVRFEDVADAIMYWYQMDELERGECGVSGRDFCLTNGLTAEQMGNKMIEMFNYFFESRAESRPKFTLNKVEQQTYQQTGIVA